MNDSQRNSMIDRIQKEYDREKDGPPLPEVRAHLLIAEVLVEIDRSLQVFADEIVRDRVRREKDDEEFEKDQAKEEGDDE